MFNIFKQFADVPTNFSYGFQDPATQWMLGIIDLHDSIVFYLIIILTVVVWLLISALNSVDHLSNLYHGNTIEVIWTITPAMILWVIGLPSLKLLYMMDEILDAELTVKAIANQWYSYNAINKSKVFANRKKILKNKSEHHKNSSIILNPYWVTGFTDAEGCFSMNMRITKNGNFTITSTFKIAQDIKDIDILYNLKNFFKVGQISIHKNEVRLEIKGSHHALKYVLPHFDKYPQITQKYGDYILWKNIVRIVDAKEHTTLEGFRKCLTFKAFLNKGQNDTLKTYLPNNFIPYPRQW